MKYQSKLKNPLWQKKRLEVFNRDNFCCQLCKDDKSELHVHHLRYTGEPWESKIEDLQTLCDTCHEICSSLDNGTYVKEKTINGVVRIYHRDNGVADLFIVDKVIGSGIDFLISFTNDSQTIKYLHENLQK